MFKFKKYSMIYSNFNFHFNFTQQFLTISAFFKLTLTHTKHFQLFFSFSFKKVYILSLLIQ